jgi:hypothetical protein
MIAANYNSLKMGNFLVVFPDKPVKLLLGGGWWVYRIKQISSYYQYICCLFKQGGCKPP